MSMTDSQLKLMVLGLESAVTSLEKANRDLEQRVAVLEEKLLKPKIVVRPSRCKFCHVDHEWLLFRPSGRIECASCKQSWQAESAA